MPLRLRVSGFYRLRWGAAGGYLVADLPFEQVYWREDVAYAPLRACSAAARGLYVEVRALCWYATPRGALVVEGRAVSLATLSGLANIPPAIVEAGLVELTAHGVLDLIDGVYRDRRMTAADAKRAATGGPTPTERELADRAIRESLETLGAEAERRAKARARSARYRSSRRAQKTLDQMRSFAAMEAATARADGAVNVTLCVTPEERDCHVTEGVRHVTENVTNSVADQSAAGFSTGFLPRVYNHIDSENPSEPAALARPPAVKHGGRAAALAALQQRRAG
jgi:hypothetical protein